MKGNQLILVCNVSEIGISLLLQYIICSIKTMLTEIDGNCSETKTEIIHVRIHDQFKEIRDKRIRHSGLYHW